MDLVEMMVIVMMVVNLDEDGFGGDGVDDD